MTYQEAIEKYNKGINYCPPDYIDYLRNIRKNSEPFIAVAKSVKYAFATEEKDFDSYVETVNKKFKKEYGYSFDVIKIAKTGEIIDLPAGEPYILTEPMGDNNSRYFVHKNADDYIFAGILKYLNDNDAKLLQKNGFKDWFISVEECDCSDKKKEECFPTVRWHFYEYILYKELNGKYRFSVVGKLTCDEDYSKSIGGRGRKLGKCNGLQDLKKKMEEND